MQSFGAKNTASGRWIGGRFCLESRLATAIGAGQSMTSDNANLSDILRARQVRRFMASIVAKSAVLRYPSGMLDRADSPGIQAVAPPAATPLPAWARPANPPETEAEAAFLAGAALARLDVLVRANPPWFGVWRQRLALGAAVASVARAGRGEDAAVLRDAVHLTRPGADPGPAGRRLLAWRALTSGSVGQWRSAIARAAEALDVRRDEALQSAIEAAANCADGNRLAPFAAARCHQFAQRALAPAGGAGDLLAAGLADTVLALKLKWPFALPLLGTGQRGDGPRSMRKGHAGEGEAAEILFGYTCAAAQAADLAADLARRAQKLAEAAPKLRAKGAGAALQALFDEDSLSATTRISGLSERGARRLFERLVALDAVRELTGRATFRLYGL